MHSPETSGKRPELEGLSDDQLLDAANNPDDPIQMNPQNGRVHNGNGRAYELKRRAALPESKITPDTPIHYEPYVPQGIREPWEGLPDLRDFFRPFGEREE